MTKVMIVEDEMITAMALRNVLQRHKYKVCTLASSGEKAFKIAEEEAPDIAVMDIRLKGDLGGTDVAEHLDSNFGIPSIFMSGYNEQFIQQLLKDQTRNRYLKKPVDSDKLIAMIEEVLKANPAT